MSGDSSARRRSLLEALEHEPVPLPRAYCGTMTYLVMSRAYSRGSSPTGTRGMTCPRPWESRVVERSSTGVSNSSESAKASATKS